MWVDFANKNGSVILYDAAYEAYIHEEDVPHSIFECAGARECAVFARFDIAAAKLVVDGIPASRRKRSGMRRSDNGIIIRK